MTQYSRLKLHGCGGILIATVFSAFAYSDHTNFRRIQEISVDPYGGIPFCVDLDSDGATEILWLQSPGVFHSQVLDVEPWKGTITDKEKQHFCLTATDAEGNIRWQIGEPWDGSRPFVTHGGERALDAADIDGDGALEIVCTRRNEILVIDALTGQIENSAKTLADNALIVRLGHTGSNRTGWTILVKNTGDAITPYEHGNPVWFYDCNLNLLKTASYHGAGHAPQAIDIDGDGLDEFLIGFNLVEHDLSTAWTFHPVAKNQWNADEMHVDDIATGEIAGKKFVAIAASNVAYLLDAETGRLFWKREGVHPQHCQMGPFQPDLEGQQVFVHNKRADLQLYDNEGNELWRITPPANFPLGQAAPCKRQKFHVFDPTTLIEGVGPGGTDLLIFTDGGWPYVINGLGQRCLEFAHTSNVAQDWGEVPGRPDDYGYGYYARVADFNADGEQEVLINDRRFAWFYKIDQKGSIATVPRSDGRILHADFENYTDGVVQALNAGVRWLGDPFSNRKEGTVEITRRQGFSGSRCAHVQSKEADEIARVQLQRRFDAPEIKGDTVSEVVFRPVQEGSVDIEDMIVWAARSMSGHAVGLKIVANGDTKSGTYQIDIRHATEADDRESQLSDRVVKQFKQSEWIRIIQHRRLGEGVVDLWVGPPGQESHVGTWPDLSAKRELARLEFGDTSNDQHFGSGYWDDVRLGGLLRENDQVASPEPPLRDVSQELPVIESPIVVGQSKHLFIDDMVIESSSALARTLHPVRKHPNNPLIVPEHSWEGKCVLLYGGVIRDPESSKLRMWYLAWGKQIDQPTFVCYAESEDGLRWTKPELGLVGFRESKQNNIVLSGWSQTTIHYDPHDPNPARRYKGLLRINGTRAFLSPDGLNWRDMGVVLEQAYDGTTAHWDPVNKKWIAMVKIFGDGKRARGYAESKDFLNWSDTYYMATVDDRDAPGDQMYALYMFHYETTYFGLLRMYHTDTDIVDIQLATSRNAKHWDRAIRTPFIPTSPTKGEWDYANNSVPSTPPIRVGDELWFYYSGRSVLHNVVPNDGAIGLGTLRIDGFMSMDANERGGVLTTKPLELTGRTLYLNADASEGKLQVEIIGEDGKSIAPFSVNNCEVIQSDRVRHAVKWVGSDSLGSLHNDSVRLRFHLKTTRLYAFWSE